ncbi:MULTISPECIES: NfeD family protein [unclassified Corynebacterium]|uniref:NfeD family protein n=1 Tax=unclassified Corynebacterium TaxID=2624378 RepID=UPI0030AB6EDF
MASLIWFGLSLLFVFAELLVGDLSMLMLGGGALAAAGVSLADTPVWVDIIVFVVSTAGLMGAVRPVLRRKMTANDHSHEVESSPKSLPGKSAMVVEKITADSGLIRLSGDLWTARPIDPGITIDPGTRVTVINIDGNTAVVDKEV